MKFFIVGLIRKLRGCLFDFLKPLREIIDQYNEFIFAYLKEMSIEPEINEVLSKYIQLVTDRAYGSIRLSQD